MLVKQLKPKGSKLCVDERLSRIICIGEVHFICIGSDLLECSLFILFSCLMYVKEFNICDKKMKGVNDPFIVIVGEVSHVEDCALVCNGKIVIKARPGFQVPNMVLLLIAFCHVFNVEYNSEVREVMEFLQEKLLGLTEGRKHSTAFTNLFRSITCLQEQVILSGHDSDADSDDTRLEGADTLESQLSVY